MGRVETREEIVEEKEIRLSIHEELAHLSEQLGKPMGSLLRKILEKI